MAGEAQVEPFHLDAPQAALDELKRRLAAARWPDRELVGDWSQGVPLAKLRALTDHWRDAYDWRRCERTLNGLGQHRTAVDGLGVHFLHVRSPEAGALPLLITHGWPGSVLEFHKVIGPLTDPVRHGGDAADAFHLVAPSLPGFGFSDKPTGLGWNPARIAAAWLTLMRRLDYGRFVAQGGDYGSLVTSLLATMRPPELAAIHLNTVAGWPTEAEMAELTTEETEAVARARRYQEEGAAYALQQRTRPQTLAYGLADSPVAQAAWIYEKFHAWTDCNGDPESVLTHDEMLDNITLYWLSNTGASSAWLYWETGRSGGAGQALQVDVPTGCSIFPHEIFTPSRRWAERNYSNIVHWNRLDRGGHFAALEQPGLFVQELRDCFRQFRRERHG